MDCVTNICRYFVGMSQEVEPQISTSKVLEGLQNELCTVKE